MAAMAREPLGRKLYISLAGNIGAGKSTAVALLADTFGWQPYYEFVADQPYLRDYYKDPARWGFHSQIWFLSQRFDQQQEIADTPVTVVQDRSIYEDYEVFVKGLLEQNILSHRDFRTYRRLYQSLLHVATPPTLMVYLRASVATLQARIQARARSGEERIAAAYLEHLNRRYEEWFRRFDLCPVLTVDMDALDIVEREADRQRLIEEVRIAVGLRADGELQLELPGIDRTALVS